MSEHFTAPDVLVLASGGTLGEAWMSGLLAGVEDAVGHDFRATESFVGTSAGALVAAALVAGQRPRRPRQGPGNLALNAGDAVTQPTVVPDATSQLLSPWIPIPRSMLLNGASSIPRDRIRSWTRRRSHGRPQDT